MKVKTKLAIIGMSMLILLGVGVWVTHQGEDRSRGEQKLIAGLKQKVAPSVPAKASIRKPPLKKAKDVPIKEEKDVPTFASGRLTNGSSVSVEEAGEMPVDISEAGSKGDQSVKEQESVETEKGPALTGTEEPAKRRTQRIYGEK